MRKPQLELIQEKISDRTALGRRLEQWRLRSERIVFTNGCFDVLHRGHLAYLSAAADLGDRLVIGLNSDSSVRQLKGPGRPVNRFDDRALALAALCFTDAIIGFEEDTPLELIRFVQPDVLVKGGDYTREQIVGADVVENGGGQVAIIALTEGYSTTSFLDRIGKK